MRRLRHGLELILLIVLAVGGCAHRDVSLRPPKRPEELVVPPVADGRFSTPPRYPEALNQDLDPERRGAGQGGTPNVGAMNMGGMGGGMGGMGGMGGGMPMMGGMGGNMLGGYGR
jgi:hypothetical protein